MTRREPLHDPPATYDWRRHTKAKQRGKALHAFEPETGDGAGAVSLCGMVPRHRTAPTALWGHLSKAAAACHVCRRVADGRAPLYNGHDLSALTPRGPAPRTVNLDAAVALARDLRDCAAAWLPEVRLLGNLTAEEIGNVAKALIDLADDRRPR